MALSPQAAHVSGGCFPNCFSNAVTRSSSVAILVAITAPRLTIAVPRFQSALACFQIVHVERLTMSEPSFDFRHAESGMTRFPPNVEQISVEHESLRTWLVVRRNETALRFPLTKEDCAYLAALLLADG
jgi:hypothetical protein